LPFNDVIVETDLRIWQTVLLETGKVKKKPEEAFVLGYINNNPLLVEMVQLLGLFLYYLDPGKEKLENKLGQCPDIIREPAEIIIIIVPGSRFDFSFGPCSYGF